MHHRHRFMALVALLGVFASITSVGAEFLPIILFRRGLPVGPIILGLTIFSFLISPVAVFGVSYWFGSTVDVRSEYRWIALISGVIGVVASIGGPLALLIVDLSPYRTFSLVGSTLIWIRYAIEAGIKFPLASVAGASVAYFQSTSLEGGSMLSSSPKNENQGKDEWEPDVEYGRLDCIDTDEFSETYRFRKRTANGPRVICKRELTEPDLKSEFQAGVKHWADLSDREGVVPILNYGDGWFERPDYEDGSLGECDRPLAAQVEALSAATMTIHRVHEDGIVHGGLTPGMILLDGETIDVSDWELAKAFAEYRDVSAYDAPEQIAGEEIDERTDVYRLGAIAYFVATGQPPNDEPPSERNRDVSEQFDTVCETAMATDPDDRYQSAMKFDDMLRWAVFRG